MCLFYCSLLGVKTAPAFREFTITQAFTSHKSVSLSTVPLKYDDVDLMLFFEAVNRDVEVVELISDKLEQTSLCALGRFLASPAAVWSQLTVLNLSYNVIETSTMQALVAGIAATKPLKVLKLAGCSIYANCAHVLATHMATDKHIRELDVSFNYIGAMGAISIANFIKTNCTTVPPQFADSWCCCQQAIFTKVERIHNHRLVFRQNRLLHRVSAPYTVPTEVILSLTSLEARRGVSLRFIA